METGLMPLYSKSRSIETQHRWQPCCSVESSTLKLIRKRFQYCHTFFRRACRYDQVSMESPHSIVTKNPGASTKQIYWFLQYQCRSVLQKFDILCIKAKKWCIKDIFDILSVYNFRTFITLFL